ncbi:unnamed protein product [Phyllotreta striolata]|uniref:Odorant receptor n=1 Tax=Phyllotreta striolata TaxID=444603 RepID=A0A9N9XN91_PHYSR|nr:unnamed protein product [Phyllotreta striolata]
MLPETRSKHGYPADFFEANELIRKITGMWLPTKHHSIITKTFYFSYVFCLYGFGFYFLVCEIIIVNDVSTEISKLVSYIGMLFTHLVGCLKFSILVFGRTKLQKIMNILQDSRYFYEPNENFSPGLFLVEGKKTSAQFSMLVLIMYSCVGASAHISSLVTFDRIIEGDSLEGTNFTCQDFMQYYFKIPFETNTKERCKLAFFFMDFGLLVFALVIACYDGVLVTILNCLKCQILVVCNVFKTLRSRCLSQLGLPVWYETFSDHEHVALEREMYRQLSHTTRHLQALLSVTNDIEFMFTFVTLAQTLASLLIFASCLYVASSVSMTSPEFFAQMEYFSCVLVQFLLICWYGNEITTSGELIRSSLYESDWYSSSMRFKNSMIITMMRMQRPLYLSIGKFSPLTLVTFVGVCRGSFSYFALFKSVQ